MCGESTADVTCCIISFELALLLLFALGICMSVVSLSFAANRNPRYRNYGYYRGGGYGQGYNGRSRGSYRGRGRGRFRRPEERGDRDRSDEEHGDRSESEGDEVEEREESAPRARGRGGYRYCFVKVFYSHALLTTFAG